MVHDGAFYMGTKQTGLYDLCRDSFDEKGKRQLPSGDS